MIIIFQNINKNPCLLNKKELYKGKYHRFLGDHTLSIGPSPWPGNPDVWISRNDFLDSLQQFMRRKAIAPETVMAARKAQWPEQMVAVLRTDMTFNALELLSTLPRDVRELVVPC